MSWEDQDEILIFLGDLVDTAFCYSTLGKFCLDCVSERALSKPWGRPWVSTEGVHLTESV